MKASEILRKLADVIDQRPVVVNINNGAPADTEKPTEEPVADDELGVMIPPLQQKIELAKKAHGVDSVYTQDEQPDELAVIKQNAGLRAIAVPTDDEPFEG